LTIPFAIQEAPDSNEPVQPPEETFDVNVTIVTANITNTTNASTPAGSGRRLQAAVPTLFGPPVEQVYCCDYYQVGSGYEFSVCGGVAFIRTELVGGETDRMYENQPLETG